VAAGVFGIGFLVFTLMLKVAVPIMLGQFHVDSHLAEQHLGQAGEVTEGQGAAAAD